MKNNIIKSIIIVLSFLRCSVSGQKINNVKTPKGSKIISFPTSNTTNKINQVVKQQINGTNQNVLPNIVNEIIIQEQIINEDENQSLIDDEDTNDIILDINDIDDEMEEKIKKEIIRPKLILENHYSNDSNKSSTSSNLSTSQKNSYDNNEDEIDNDYFMDFDITLLETLSKVKSFSLEPKENEFKYIVSDIQINNFPSPKPLKINNNNTTINTSIDQIYSKATSTTSSKIIAKPSINKTSTVSDNITNKSNIVSDDIVDDELYDNNTVSNNVSNNSNNIINKPNIVSDDIVDDEFYDDMINIFSFDNFNELIEQDQQQDQNKFSLLRDNKQNNIMQLAILHKAKNCTKYLINKHKKLGLNLNHQNLKGNSILHTMAFLANDGNTFLYDYIVHFVIEGTSLELQNNDGLNFVEILNEDAKNLLTINSFFHGEAQVIKNAQHKIMEFKNQHYKK